MTQQQAIGRQFGHVAKLAGPATVFPACNPYLGPGLPSRHGRCFGMGTVGVHVAD